MTMTPTLGALAQASGALMRAAADSQSGAEAAVATTIDLTLLILGPVIGAFLGVVVSVVFNVLARRAFVKAATASSILARVRRSAHFTFATWGAWIGLGIALVNPHLSEWNGSSVTTFLMHVLLIAGLACLTWMAYAAAWVFEDAARARQESDKGRSRRFETQAQVLRRFTQGVVVVIGAVAIVGTFEAARQAMTTVLASAGVLSVIAGLAAQQTLGNVFAGLQLAFTDAIRVGDVVVAGDKQETGSVEEITLSYVVVRIWDERRLIIPCRYFTQTPFENWTRRAAAQLGTVELKLDWSAPMTLIRTKVEKLLTSTDLWDGRTWAVQITDSDEFTVTVRVLVSANNSANLSDLRAYLREQLIAWIVAEEPWARPVQHIEPRQTVTVEQDMSRERIARLASELAGISGANEAVAATGRSTSHAGGAARAYADSAVGGTASPIGESGAEGARERPKDAAHAARMVAARRKAKRARRRAMADRQRELAEGGSSSPDETQVISKSALRKIIEAAGNTDPQLTQTMTATSIGRGERLFSGSAEADERAAALAGPGEEAYAEREADSQRAKDRREGRRRSSEAIDPETSAALAAVGVEPVGPTDSGIGNAEPTQTQNAAPAETSAAQVTRPFDGAAPAATAEATTGSKATDAVTGNSQAVAGVMSGMPAVGAGTAATEAAHEPETDVPAPPAVDDANPTGPVDAADTTPGVRADIPAPAEAVEAAEAATASSDAEKQREDVLAPDHGSRRALDPENEDEQATTPIPARETSVKRPVQVPPPARTGRPVITDVVAALAPALVPPPEPTPQEMAASQEEVPDEPVIHPDWYAVAEEARLEEETRPAPAKKTPRVSIMDFFPAVAPTGAEADMLRAVTGQIPAVASAASDQKAAETTDEAVAGDEPVTSDEAVADDEPVTSDEAVADDEPEGSDEAVADDEPEGSDEAVADDEPVTSDEAVADDEPVTSDEAVADDEPVTSGEAVADDEPVTSGEAVTDDEPVTSDEAVADDEPEGAAAGQDTEATAVMTPVEVAQAGALDTEATQVLPTVEEQPALDETLVMPTLSATPDAQATATEAADEVEPAKAPAKKKTAKKSPAKKATSKKNQPAKKGTKKAAAGAKKDTTEEKTDDKPAQSDADKAEKAPAKKSAAKKSTAKKAPAKKSAAKKAASKKTTAKKTPTAKPAEQSTAEQ